MEGCEGPASVGLDPRELRLLVPIELILIRTKPTFQSRLD